MRFCVNCGQQLMPEARFCVSCGTAAPEGAASSATSPANQAATPEGAENRQPEYAAASVGSGSGIGSGHATAPEAAAAAPAASVPGASPATAAPAKTSAFAGVPVSDYVRDGIAALALFMSLFMTWVYGSENSTAATRVDVILITLVSVLSLSISYVWRAGVFGPSVGYRKIQDLKLLVNAPYLLLVLVYIALHLITADGPGQGSSDGMGALGAALAFGLGGALLAAQPRHGDIAPGQVDQPRNKRWIYVTLGVAVLAAVVALVQIVGLWVLYGESIGGSGILATFLALASPAILVFIALQVTKRSDGWRSVGVALGLGAGFLSLLALNDGQTLVQLSLHAHNPDFSLIFWMGFGAAVSAPSVARLTEASAAAPASRRTALLPFLYLAAGLSALLTVGAVIAVIVKAVNEYSQSSIVPQVIAVLFGLILTAGAIITARLTAKDARSVYILTSGYAGLSFVLGLVLMIVWAVKDEMRLGVIILLLAFVLPAALLAVLWLPSASRAHFRSLPASGNGTSGFTFAGAPAAPANPGPANFGQANSAPANFGQVPSGQIPQGPWGQQMQQQPAPYQQAPNQPQPVVANASEASHAPNASEASQAAESSQAAPAVSQGTTTAPAAAEAPEVAGTAGTAEVPATAETAETAATSATAETAGTVEAAEAASASPAEVPATAEAKAVPEEATAGSVPATAVAPEVPANAVAPEVLAEAANPATPLARLQELAADHPQARPAIAANPSTYPGLLAWLGQLGDPAVDAALRQRG